MKELKALERLITNLHSLPGIGKKSAERMAYSILQMDENTINEIANSLVDLKKNIKFCPICGALMEDECEICEDKTRNQTQLMVVSSPKDIFSVEKSGGYSGLYHVLGGEISISKNQQIEQLKIDKLISRIEEGKIQEIILATNPTLDGETTALYLDKILKKYPLTITRLAYGLQMGGNLDYTDEMTLLKALEGRRKM